MTQMERLKALNRREFVAVLTGLAVLAGVVLLAVLATPPAAPPPELADGAHVVLDRAVYDAMLDRMRLTCGSYGPKCGFVYDRTTHTFTPWKSQP